MPVVRGQYLMYVSTSHALTMPVVRGQYLMYVSTSHALTMPVVRGTMSGTIACDSHNVCGIARVRFEVCNLPHDWLFFYHLASFFVCFYSESALFVCSVQTALWSGVSMTILHLSKMMYRNRKFGVVQSLIL